MKKVANCKALVGKIKSLGFWKDVTRAHLHISNVYDPCSIFVRDILYGVMSLQNGYLILRGKFEESCGMIQGCCMSLQTLNCRAN